MDESAILDRIDELCEDEKLAKELKKELSTDKALKGMMNVFELDEIARLNPIDVHNVLDNKKVSKGAKEFGELCFALADSAHAGAAQGKKELGLEGGED